MNSDNRAVSGDTAPVKSRCTAPEKVAVPLTFHSTSRVKRALLCVFTASFLGHPAWLRAPGCRWCQHRDRRGADLEDEAMPTKQTNKRAKSKAEAKVSTGATNPPIAKSEHAQHRRKPRQRAAAVGTKPFQFETAPPKKSFCH